jgi:hypothetical protein
MRVCTSLFPSFVLYSPMEPVNRLILGDNPEILKILGSESVD